MLEAVLTSVPSTGTNWLLMQLLPYHGEHRYLRQIIDGKDTEARMGFTHYAISNINAGEIVKVSRGLPLWTPLRDPLLSLTTWLAGGQPGRDIPNRIRGWYDMAYVDAARQGDVIYVPVDLPEVGHAVMKAQGKYANFAEPINSKRGRHPYRARYEDRDHTYVPEYLWREIRALEEPMRPILERVGYKDLMWWT